jgi:hypothetical protein
MKRRTCALSLITALGLAAGTTVMAQAPTYKYDTETDAYGLPTAVATTPPTEGAPASQYVVAAVQYADVDLENYGELEIKAWSDNGSEFNEIGHYHAGGNPITSVAVAGLDSSHVISADVDNTGDFFLRTWTLGGTAAVFPLNVYESGAGKAAEGGEIGVVTLGPNLVVTASEDALQNLIVQAWTVGDTTAEPATLGLPGNGGAVAQLSIAAIDSQTVITATTNGNDDLVITTWGVSSTGVQMQDQSIQSTQVHGTTPDVSIAAGTVYVLTYGPPFLQAIRTAVTPTVNTGGINEVLYWSIDSSGKISKPVVKNGALATQASVTAACMLSGGVPMTVNNEQAGSAWDVEVGDFGFTGESSLQVTMGLYSEIYNVGCAAAGDNFNVLNPYIEVNAFFISASLDSPSALPTPSAPGHYRLQKWSYPVHLPNT